MQNPIVFPLPISTASKPNRLHYVDWLRVLAISIVFLFHSVHPFDMGDWQLKNADQSLALTIILTILSLWGMPFFFMIAGTGSYFALQRRTARQYASERFKRLAIPYVVFTIIFFFPIVYLEWVNKTQIGRITHSFSDQLQLLWQYFTTNWFSPRWFGLGYHLWFLGFLFAFAMITLPLFMALKTERGKSFIATLAKAIERPAGIFIFILPLMIVQFCFRPFFVTEHDWADFFVQMSFFVLGYLLYTDARFSQAIRKNGWWLLVGGIIPLLLLLILYFIGDPFSWSEDPTNPLFYLVYACITAIAYCLSVFMLSIGMCWLEFTNGLLKYAQEAVLPIFILHQPVIIGIAFFVVQWQMGILPKLLIVVIGSFVVCLALYQFVIQRVGFLRFLFGIK